MTTTDAKILYAHYLAGRYPNDVPIGLPDDLREVPAERIAEICVARAVGAWGRFYFQDRNEVELPTVHEVEGSVAALLYPKAAPAEQDKAATEAKQ